MQHKRSFFWFMIIGLALIVVSATALMTTSSAQAQCGSQASSCKNCHEVQGEMPVNNDGTGWHESHAFGDFCYVCHGGNQQATDKDAAHEGMVDPLSDVQAACQQCHVTDLDARAKVYADALGVEIGGNAPPADSGGESAPAADTETASAPAAAGGDCTQLVVNDPNSLDYAARYDEIVLGKKPINWGNMILLGIILLTLIGGGGFIIVREKLVAIQFGDTSAVDEEYPADAVAMLPSIASLKSQARQSLARILESKKAEKILALIDEIIAKDEE